MPIVTINIQDTKISNMAESWFGAVDSIPDDKQSDRIQIIEHSTHLFDTLRNNADIKANGLVSIVLTSDMLSAASTEYSLFVHSLPAETKSFFNDQFEDFWQTL